jgi:peroxiredoxin family protein
MAADLGDAKLLPCSMAVDLLKALKDDLDPVLGPPTGLDALPERRRRRATFHILSGAARIPNQRRTQNE